jgi:lipoprotein-releasing system permease protein
MVSKTNLKISIAHLTSRRKQALIAILSVTFGVSMYVVMTGFMSGANNVQTEMAFTSLAHIRIYNDVQTEVPIIITPQKNTLINIRNAKAIQYTEGIKNADKIVKEIESNPEITAITTQINMSVTYRNGSIKEGGILSGVDVVNEDKMFKIKDYMVDGKWEELAYSNTNIILGVGLAKKLSLATGSNLSITTSDNVTKNCKIIGLIKTGFPTIDDSKAFIRKSAALQLVSKNRSYATDIQINVSDYNKAKQIAESLEDIVPYKVEDWQEGNIQLVSVNALREILALAVSIVIIIVAGFGIYNIMNMIVNEKIKDIAILKALGFGGKDVVHIFLTQAVIIGILGGISGILLGFSISNMLSYIPFEMMAMDHLPMLFNLKDYILAFWIGLAITLVAGYLPARKASKVDPVEIIKG